MLFKAGDAEALATAVMDLLREPAPWPALKAAAMRCVETERRWKVTVARYEGVYAGLTQPPRHR